MLNDPDKYKADKRPAFQHVAVAALAHDDAMHEAGDAQRMLEDYDNRALPPALAARADVHDLQRVALAVRLALHAVDSPERSLA